MSEYAPSGDARPSVNISALGGLRQSGNGGQSTQIGTQEAYSGTGTGSAYWCSAGIHALCKIGGWKTSGSTSNSLGTGCLFTQVVQQAERQATESYNGRTGNWTPKNSERNIQKICRHIFRIHEFPGKFWYRHHFCMVYFSQRLNEMHIF